MKPTILVDKRAALANHTLFSHLNPTEREQILALGMERCFGNGQLICQQGDASNNMMLVLCGQIRVSIFSKEGRELVLAIIPPGGCFGEIALFDGKPRTANATAIGKCVLFTITRQTFIAFLEDHPQVAVRLLAVLSERLRTTDELIESLAFQNLPARLASLLVRLAATHGAMTPTGVCITCRLSQHDIGNLIATSRESINRQLRTWQAEGLLTIAQGHITLLKPTALNSLAHSS
jgi:CRP-like cAMP-binding protein